MNILIVTTMSGSYSILANIKLFAEDLIKNGFDAMILIPEESEKLFENTNVKYITYQKGSQANFKSILKINIQKHNFDLVLFSNFYFTHPFDLIDQEIIEFLEKQPLIKAAIDPFLLHLNKKWPLLLDLSNLGGSPSKSINLIPSWIKVLQYGQLSQTDPEIYYYNHLTKIPTPLKIEEKKEVLSNYLRVSDTKKNILFPFNRTHLMSIYKFCPSYLDLLAFILGKTFEDINERIRLIVISNNPVFKDTIKDLEIMYLSELDYDSYQKLISSVDLFLTDNSITDSLFYAGLVNTISVVLYNSVNITDGNISFFEDTLQLDTYIMDKIVYDKINIIPFRVMPFGWYDHWKKFDSHYFDSVDFIKHLEILDINKNKKVMSELLFNEQIINESSKKREQYLTKLKLLPSPSDIIKRIINDYKK